MASCVLIYVRKFKKFGIGIQAILRFRLSNLRVCNVGISDERDLKTCAVDMGSGGMIFLRCFMTIRSDK
jgi:hypothetical protein